MPTVIDVKSGSFEGDISLIMNQNWVQLQQDFKLIYYVVADNYLQTPIDIQTAPGIPVLGTKVYNAYCTKIAPKATESVIHFLTSVLTQLWEVEVSFSTLMRDPNDTTPEVNWGGELDKDNLEQDLYTGAKPTTTAGEPIFIEKQVPYIILSIRRQETYPFDPGTLAMYVGKTNLTPFYGFPVGTCLMLPMRVEEDTQNSKRICWVTYEIKVKLLWNFDGTLQTNTWQSRPLNQGHMVRPGLGLPPKVAVDKNNSPIVVNLDLTGQRLIDQNGGDLKAVGSPSTSLNRFMGVYFLDADPWQAGPPVINFVQPNISDVGSTIIIGAGGPWVPGSYLISGVGQINNTGPVLWFLSESGPNIPAPPGTVGGVWQIQRAPQYLFFNRAYYVEFNNLTLGPY